MWSTDSEQLKRDVPPLEASNGGLSQIRIRKKVNDFFLKNSQFSDFQMCIFNLPSSQNRGLT
jgi:hypothetical protein